MEGGKKCLPCWNIHTMQNRLKQEKKKNKATQQCAERRIPSLKAHRRGRRGLRLILLPCLAGYCQLVVISALGIFGLCCPLFSPSSWILLFEGGKIILTHTLGECWSIGEGTVVRQPPHGDQERGRRNPGRVQAKRQV